LIVDAELDRMENPPLEEEEEEEEEEEAGVGEESLDEMDA